MKPDSLAIPAIRMRKYPQPMRLTLKIITFAFLIITIGKLSAQSSDGRSSSDKSGFALVKPQPWSPENQTSILKFLSYVDRSARGTPGAGYYVFQLPDQSEKQVASAQIVKIVTPTKIPNNITDASDLGSLKKAIEYYNNIGQNFPAAAPFVAEMSKPLLDVQSKFDAGMIKIDGTWQSAVVHQKQSVAKTEGKLNQDLYDAVASKALKAFNLTSNNYYLELLENAKTDPELATRLEALKSRYEQLLAAEELQTLLSKINDPALGSENLAEIIFKLKKIPSPDSRIRRILEQSDLAAEISALSREIKNGLELQYSGSTDPTLPMPLSSDLSAKIQKIETDVTIFKSSNPPGGLSIPDKNIEAEILFSKNITDLNSALKSRNYSKAESYATPLVGASALIGPKTNDSMKGILSLVTTKLATFTKLRDEAAMLAQAGKKKEALAKYSEAVTVMPDSQISAKIEDLKKSIPPAK